MIVACRILKHKLVNNFLPNLDKTQTKQVHPDMASHITMIAKE